MTTIASPEPVSPFRNDILRNRVVVVTGGATGIGYACAEAFGAHGAKVAICSRRRGIVEEAVAKLKAKGVDAYGTTVDVRDFAKTTLAADEIAKHFGRIDFLINNAAGNFMVSAENLTPGGLATVLGIDLQGVFHMSKACLPYLKAAGQEHGNAVILNITATLQDIATPFQSHAAAAKAGIDVLTNQFGVEWAEYGIRSVGIAPGGISGTVGGPGGRVFGNLPDGNAKAIRSRGGVPSGRWGRVGDIALAAVFLCSEGAPWITATRLTVDGGSCHRVLGFVEMKNKIQSKSELEKATTKSKVPVAAASKL